MVGAPPCSGWFTEGRLFAYSQLMMSTKQLPQGDATATTPTGPAAPLQMSVLGWHRTHLVTPTPGRSDTSPDVLSDAEWR